ncbi:MAG: hypothetical protein JOZ42_00455 [Acetobacteraceae bacterium]|nr:hypothetical protein [Acetobacteraceae bacterium]
MRGPALQGALGICLLMMAGCAGPPGRTIDPLTKYGKADPYFESECTVKDKAGDCLKATCKEDAVSNCNDWAAGCLNHDGAYQGTSAGGTCTKVL